MFQCVLILQKLFNSASLLYISIGQLRDLAGRNLTQKPTILVGLQSILYSQLIYFTYIYLSEARTSAKYHNNLRELLKNTEDTVYFTQSTTRIKAHVQSL